MNSSRIPPGAATNAMRRRPNGPSTISGPHTTSWPTSVAVQLGVEVVGEQRRVQEALGGQVDGVLVDGAGEQRDLHRPEEHVGALGAVPLHPVADLGAGALVERARGVEVGDLHRQVGHPRHAHARDLYEPGARGAHYRRADASLDASRTWRRRWASRDMVGGAPGVDAARAALRPLLRRRGRRGRRRCCTTRSADGDAGSAVVSYLLVFFAIWWAWMNFTWFASAYDNDDVVYRLLVLVQIAGVLDPRRRRAARVRAPRLRHRGRRLPRDAGRAGHASGCAPAATIPSAAATAHRYAAGRVAVHGRVGRAWRCSAGRCGRSS